jgi:hypothetical protein
VVYPALRPARDAFNRAEDRLAQFRNHVLHRAREYKIAADAEHHMPHLAAPVTPLLRSGAFAEPVYLEAE